MRQTKIMANTELFRIQAQKEEKQRKNEEVIRCKTKY